MGFTAKQLRDGDRTSDGLLEQPVTGRAMVRRVGRTRSPGGCSRTTTTVSVLGTVNVLKAGRAPLCGRCRPRG